MSRFKADISRVLFLLFGLVGWMMAQASPQAPTMIQAGTPEDKALRAAESENDPAKRIQLMDQFLKDFPSMDHVVELNELYTVTYHQLKNLPKVVEYGEKALAVNQDDMEVLPLVINALLEQQNQGRKAYEYAKRYQALTQNLDAVQVGRTVISTADQARMKADAKTLLDAARQQAEYGDIQAAYQETDPAKKIGILESFTKEFPDSQQLCNAYSMMALTYLQQQKIAQSVESAQNCLKINPNNLDMLVLLSDLQIEDKTKLKETTESVFKAVELADAMEGKPVPEGTTPEDWTKRKNYLRGTAHGLRGYLDVKAGLYSKAIPDLELANKLLGDDSATLYRLGFALAKVHRTREAGVYLGKAAKLPGPFQQAAKDALSQLQR